jgi:sec-independent protein translocase protein TatC
VALDQELIDSETKDKEMSFFDHLDTLRKHLIRAALAIVVFTIFGFIYIDYIFHNIILGPLNNDFFTYRKLCEFSRTFYHSDEFCVGNLDYTLQNTEMAGQFMMSFRLSFLVGLILAMPVILWQLWLFIKPALSDREKKKTRGFVFYTSSLFGIGILFGYYVLCPISVNFFAHYSLSSLIKNEINMQNVISFMTLLVMGTGIIFELPVLMYFLARLGLITSAFLVKYRKYAFVVILIVAAIVTPPDIVSQLILTIPLYSLFELGIFIIKRVEKTKKAEKENE